MEMTHVIYLTIIALLVAAGLWLLNQLRKVVDEKIEKEKQLDRISKAAFELFEYANSDEKNAIYKLGEWVQTDGTIIKGLKLYNEAYVKPYRVDADKLLKTQNAEKELKKSKADLELCKIDKDMLLKSCKRRKGEVEALKKQVKQLKPKAQETETLTAKLQSAYGRIGALTQQLNRMRKEEAKADVEKVDAEKVELPKECPEHLFERFPEDIRQMAWEAMCNQYEEEAKIAYEKKRCYSLFEAFTWSKTAQRYKFWNCWHQWDKKGAYPNFMPPRDPKDPMYK